MQKLNVLALAGNTPSPDGPDDERRRAAFARSAVNDAFSRIGHRHDWRWERFRDTSPAKLAKKRERVLWENGGGPAP